VVGSHDIADGEPVQADELIVWLPSVALGADLKGNVTVHVAVSIAGDPTSTPSNVTTTRSNGQPSVMRRYVTEKDDDGGPSPGDAARKAPSTT
jgi:hypothetical protein